MMYVLPHTIPAGPGLQFHTYKRVEGKNASVNHWSLADLKAEADPQWVGAAELGHKIDEAYIVRIPLSRAFPE